MAMIQPHPLAKKFFFGENWLNLGKFGWICAKLTKNWENLRLNLGKSNYI